MVVRREAVSLFGEESAQYTMGPMPRDRQCRGFLRGLRGSLTSYGCVPEGEIDGALRYDFYSITINKARFGDYSIYLFVPGINVLYSILVVVGTLFMEIHSSSETHGSNIRYNTAVVL